MTEAQSPRVCISILNWNGAEKTLQCLQSLQLMNYSNYRCIVVDNASSDNSVEQIRANFPTIKILQSPNNLGYAGGNRLALEYAILDGRAELFWILNNDAIVQENTLGVMIDAYLRHGVAIYGSVPLETTDSSGKLLINMRHWESGKIRQIRYADYHEHFFNQDEQIVEALSGSSLLIPITLIKNYGFIDETFFMYCEDTDYCFRLRHAGVKNILVPRSIIFHSDGASHKVKYLSTLQPIITYYRARNKIILRKRHFGNAAFLRMIFVQFFYAIGWAVLSYNRGAIALRCAYYTLVGIRDAIFNRMGKTLAPEAYLTTSESGRFSGISSRKS